MDDDATPRAELSEQDNGRARALTLIVATLAAWVFLQSSFGGEKTKFEDLAMAGAVAVQAERDGTKIHAISYNESVATLAAAARRPAEKRVVWLGNSQLHAVNHHKPGQTSAPGILFDRLRPKGIDLVALGLNNANLQEHYVAFELAIATGPRFDMVVLPVVFDDLRETGIRQTFQVAMFEPAVERALGKTRIGVKLLAARADPAKDDEDADLAGLRNTLQERSERSLNGWLERHWSVWRARREARGQFMLALYQLRNTVLNVNAQSKRPLIRGRYDDNIAALTAIVDRAAMNDVAVFLYVVPLRNDVEPPYVLTEYAKFQGHIRMLAEERGIAFANLGDLVPAEFWGQKGSTNLGGKFELDFMHFAYEGHVLLASAIEQQIDKTLRKQPPSKQPPSKQPPSEHAP